MREHIGNISSFVRYHVVLGINAMSMTLFCRVHGVSMSVRVSTMAMAVVVEEEQAENVGCQTKTANDKYELGVGDLLGFDEALDRVKEDGEAEGDEEDAVHQRTEGLSALPLYVVSSRR